MPGHLFEDNPFDEGTTLRGTDTPGYRPEKPAGTTHSSRSDLSPREQLERQAEFHSSTQDEAWLSCSNSAAKLRSESDLAQGKSGEETWVSCLHSRWGPLPLHRTQVSSIAGGFFTSWATRKAQEKVKWVAYPFSSGSSWPRNQQGSPALQADSLPTELSGKPYLTI